MEDAKEKEKKSVKQIYISILALTLMNVSIIAGIGNDVQQAFYGLSAVTYFAIGAICFFIPTALVAAELASGWSNRGGIFRWVGEGLGKGWALTCLLILWFQTMISFGMGCQAMLLRSCSIRQCMIRLCNLHNTHNTKC